MRIGIDFDNTVVMYGNLFHKYAVEQKLIHSDVSQNKKEIRDFIYQLPKGRNKWIELQALVYGVRMDEAQPADGVERFLSFCKEASIPVVIISHKTEYPSRGPRVNLQDAAWKWLAGRGFLSQYGLCPDDVVFCSTIKKKLSAISKKECTHFIDDLVEVFEHKDFPKGTKKVLYSQSPHDDCPPDITQFETWGAIQSNLFNDVRK